jgi:hypothetical protein
MQLFGTFSTTARTASKVAVPASAVKRPPPVAVAALGVTVPAWKATTPASLQTPTPTSPAVLRVVAPRVAPTPT